MRPSCRWRASNVAPRCSPRQGGSRCVRSARMKRTAPRRSASGTPRASSSPPSKPERRGQRAARAARSRARSAARVDMRSTAARARRPYASGRAARDRRRPADAGRCRATRPRTSRGARDRRARGPDSNTLTGMPCAASAHGRGHAGIAGADDRHLAYRGAAIAAAIQLRQPRRGQAIQSLRSGVSEVRRDSTRKPSRSISVEQGPVDRRHDQPGALRAAVDGGQRGEGARIVGRAHAPPACASARLRLRLSRAARMSAAEHAVRAQLVHRQVDAVLARVLADVADDVGELERDAEQPARTPACARRGSRRCRRRAMPTTPATW